MGKNIKPVIEPSTTSPSDDKHLRRAADNLHQMQNTHAPWRCELVERTRKTRTGDLSKESSRYIVPTARAENAFMGLPPRPPRPVAKSLPPPRMNSQINGQTCLLDLFPALRSDARGLNGAV